MAEAVEGGSLLAWRLLATLEGGSLILATTALLAYTARRKLVKRRKPRRGRPVTTVLVSNTTSPLGIALRTRLQSLSCTVVTVSEEATDGATSGAEEKVDALVIVGAEPRSSNLDGMAGLVAEDVYENMKLLDKLSPRVKPDGYLAWACTGSTSGAFSVTANAFDAALQASLSHLAETSNRIPIWVGRCERIEEAVDKIVNELMAANSESESTSPIRNAASKVSGYIGRWLKIAS